MIPKPLIEAIRRVYRLDWHGIHGVSHWARVRQNGLVLAEQTGANRRVIELFAFLHDSHRHNDHIDPGHGPRAAEFVESLRGTLIHLSDAEFELLTHACRFHTSGQRHDDATVMTCWDADRLDLGRVHIISNPDLLLTAAARDKRMIEWAYARSISGKTSPPRLR